jgi:putative superfamily III holin-X
VAAVAHNGATSHPGRDAPSMGSLLTGIVTDLEVLVRQEIQLASTEIRAEVDEAAGAVLGLAVGGMTIALGIVLLGGGAALYLAHRLEWPTWMGLVTVGAGLAVFGTILLGALWRRLARLENPLWRRTPSNSDRR